MTTDNPLVSIIVRTKDRPKLLRRAMQSVAAQTYRPIEVVLVNDGGDDLDTDEIGGILAGASLSYVRLHENRGRAGAGNAGIENAKGKYIGFLDDDDELYPDHAATLVAFLEQSDVTVAYTDCEIVVLKYDIDKEEYVERDSFVLFSEDFSGDLFLLRNYVPFMCLLWRAERVKALRFDPQLELYEDWDLLLRASREAPFYHIRKTTARYQRWDTQTQITVQEGFGRESYLRVLGKHWSAISPEMLFSLYKRDTDLLWQRKEDLRELLRLSKELDKRDKELNRVNKQLSVAANDIHQLSQKVGELTSEVAERNRENWALREKTEDLARQADEYEKRISDLQSVHRELEATNAGHRLKIQSLEAYVHAIESSLAWRTVTRLRRVKERVFPPGSVRRRLFDSVVSSLKVRKAGSTDTVAERGSEKSSGEGNPSAFATRQVRVPLDLRPRSVPLDIIVPVYNGYDYFVPCLESVIRNTDLTFHRLMIIDDRSPDGRVREYLDRFDKKDLHIEIFHNDENLGFTKTVNKGMKRSDRDVILLNSDTLVTARWAEKLRRAAYSRPMIATVTPFSNNATHCSIPGFLSENDIPEGYSVDSFAQFVEDISLRYYPEIPTAVGFCMYIKREVLGKIGYFDEERFDRGYGEECEFCARGRRSGFIDILDDTTYIYHKGSVSFTAQRREGIVDKHLEIIDTLYPEFLPGVRRFYDENPLRFLHRYIQFRMALACEHTLHNPH